MASAAALDALALRDLTRPAILDPRAAILERLAGNGTTFGLQRHAIALETLAATRIAIAPLFGLAALFLALALMRRARLPSAPALAPQKTRS
ncbi:MAG TPA: hypothetical protein VHB97_09230 [Polyangia bacterium]|jgi:hypothetical protein|nr:hypothetical protein [Polyangia bacterium]